MPPEHLNLQLLRGRPPRQPGDLFPLYHEISGAGEPVFSVLLSNVEIMFSPRYHDGQDHFDLFTGERLSMTGGKKFIHFLGSMKFAMILLGVLILSCVVGSIISQGQTYAWYAGRYGERAAGAIMALHLDDVFHSWWFIAITAFLCVNLLLCNILRLPSLLKRQKALADPLEAMKGEPDIILPVGKLSPDFFRKMGFHRTLAFKNEDGCDTEYASKNAAGYWGAWVCHLGVLLLILGFGLGQMLKEEYTVYGIPGQTKAIGDTGRLVTIDEFTIEKNEDGSVRQYTALLTCGDAESGKTEQGTAGVNEPATLCGMKFYQNSTGWAADYRITENGEDLQSGTLCAGEYVPVEDKPDLIIYLNAVYPDFAMVDGSPTTLSQDVKNPYYLYSAYYQGQMLGMNALGQDEELTIDEYTVTFRNPQPYTLIQVKRDPYTPLALLGGLVTLAGLILALFVQPASVWTVTDVEGRITVYGKCRKGGALFADELKEKTGDGSLSLEKS